MTGKKVRVLVVDDSLVYREVIARGISSDPYIEVVAKAVDPFDARDKILEYQPDIVTCDIEMPRMNGIEFTRRLLPQYPLPVIIVSSVSEAVFDALNAGAVEFVSKPDINSPESVEEFISELISKIRIAVRAKVTVGLGYNKLSPSHVIQNKNCASHKIIAIGASTGGTEAIFSLLKALPPTIPGIVVVQHIPSKFSQMFAERLNQYTRLKVKEASTGDALEMGKVLVAPGDQHVKVKKVGDHYTLHCYPGDKVNGHRPSVDVLFNSVAREAQKDAIGIILTGMGSDGAKGLLEMRRQGARTIGQDEQTSVVYGMPRVAFEIGAVEHQVPLGKIPQILCSIVG